MDRKRMMETWSMTIAAYIHGFYGETSKTWPFQFSKFFWVQGNAKHSCQGMVPPVTYTLVQRDLGAVKFEQSYKF